MASLADIERFLERVFERSTARLFHARVQPVQVERRVERSMERARSSHSGRTVVPGRYRVRLNPSDLQDVASQAGGPDAFAGRLADAALTFARAHAYHLPGRPGVALVADPGLPLGQIEVDAVADARRQGVAVGGARDSDGGRPDGSRPANGDPGSVVPGARAPGEVSNLPGEPAVAPAPTRTPNPIVDAIEPDRTATPIGAPPAFEEAYPGVRGDGTQTLVFRRPSPSAARAVLRVWAQDGAERTIEVDGSPLTLGRAPDNVLVLADSRVSRHHGRLQARRGALVYTDLASTNGSRVNGIRVDEIALGVGDRILVGDTVLVVEALPG
jgi:pSer/pThr/pTyr-binding forkhead associated (FHA) protein